MAIITGMDWPVIGRDRILIPENLRDRLNCFEFFTVGNPVADVVDKFAQGRTHRDFHQADVVDFTAERENLRPLRAFRTVSRERRFAFA